MGGDGDDGGGDGGGGDGGDGVDGDGVECGDGVDVVMVVLR